MASRNGTEVFGFLFLVLLFHLKKTHTPHFSVFIIIVLETISVSHDDLLQLYKE